MKINNISGKRFGRLTVLKESIRVGSKTKWLCQCDCGVNKLILKSNLISGKSKSCGCIRNEVASARLKTMERTKFDSGIGSCNYLWNRYKQSAKKKNLVFELDRELFRELTSLNCHYCKSKPMKKIKGPRSNGEYTYNGLDRKDSNLGYTKANSLPCCERCNYSKRDISYEEFITWIKRIKENF